MKVNIQGFMSLIIGFGCVIRVFTIAINFSLNGY